MPGDPARKAAGMDIHGQGRIGASAVARRARRMAAALLALGMAIAVGACGSAGQAGGAAGADADTSALDVVSSVNQWGLLARQIGGDKAEVTSILGATNVDAHDFEPSTSDIAKFSRADLVVVNGAGYDEWAVKAAGDATQVSAAQAVGAMDGDNPHLWFSKDARDAMAKELADAFSKARPANASYYAQRLKDWQQREDTLEQRMSRFAKEHPDAAYAATESVAYYLASDLGLADVTPKGYAQAVANEGEPAPADVRDFQKLLGSGQAGLLVVNPQEESDSATLIAKSASSASVPTVEVTEQVPEGTDSLIDWMDGLVDRFADALGDGGSGDATDTDGGTTGAKSTQSSSAAAPGTTADTLNENRNQ